MKKKVLALKGKANVGKSETIKNVFEQLKSKYKSATTKYEKISSTDVRVILTINGKKIGIESQGDIGDILRKSFSLFTNEKCIIIICATRSRGKTVEAVKELKPDYHVLWHEQAVKYTAVEQQPSNLAMTKKLVEEADRVINS